jgi:glyoxylase-like metal-dependent hydrolase (beta-lactamase superfamily II)
MRIETIDLHFQGTPHVIAAFLLLGPEAPVLIETGPESTLPALLDGLARHGVDPADVRDVLVTHIHLDHAGAAGWWAQQGARVHVHPVGAPHLIDPSKLLGSATRIYGARMDALWGTVRPAPAEQVIAVEDGTRLAVGGMTVTAVSTPGHAYHHHVYLLDGAAFSGDAAGIKLPANRWIDLPAPPPEFDLERWRETLDRLREIAPATLYRTHFGASDAVLDELDEFREVMEQGVAWIREMREAGMDRPAMAAEFTARMRARAEADGSAEADLRAYELANPREMSVDGIARYWRKRAER